MSILPNTTKKLHRRTMAASDYLQPLPIHFFVIVKDVEADASGELDEFPALRTQTRIV